MCAGFRWKASETRKPTAWQDRSMVNRRHAGEKMENSLWTENDGQFLRLFRSKDDLFEDARFMDV
jgi:hypothetical protein